MYSLIIIDDEEFITTSLSKYITKYHPSFLVKGTFTDAERALAFLLENPVDIMITDILMPNMDGLELIKRVRKLLPEITILIISSYSEFEYAQKACAYNVKNYLLKPVDYQELSENLDTIALQLQETQPLDICAEEDIQLFFIDLLSRIITDKDELHRRLSKLPLAEEGNQYKGCLISITLDNNTYHQWKYGIDTISTALLNNVRMHLPEYECYYLYRHHTCYFFIILSPQNIPAFSTEELAQKLYETMQWNSNIKTTATFYSIEALMSTSGFSVPAASIHHPKDSESLEDSEVISRAIGYIWNHYAENLSREDVANAVYLDSSYFSRFFKQKTGMSFISYLTTVRMEKATELLKTQMNISDIAAAVGYLHRNRFITNFRQYSGYTPTEYRKKILMRD